MLTISSRPCQLGTSINTRTEMHGDESVPACDIPLVGITLDAEELGTLLGEPRAHKALFKPERGHDEPLFPQIEPIALSDKIEDASVIIGLNSGEVHLEGVKLKGLTLKPMNGGLTLLSLKVQASGEDIAEKVGELVNCLDHTVTIEIHGGERVTKDSKQQDLPINQFGEGEQPEQGEKRRRAKKSKGERAIAH